MADTSPPCAIPGALLQPPEGAGPGTHGEAVPTGRDWTHPDSPRAPASRDRGEHAVPTTREWRQIDRDQADQDLVRRAAAWLREDLTRAQHAGLLHDEDAHALAALLDVVADDIAGLDKAVRWQTLESCRVLLGESMASPSIRRTRRR